MTKTNHKHNQFCTSRLCIANWSHRIFHLTHLLHLLRLLLSEERFTEKRIQVASLSQAAKRAEEHVFDLEENVAVVKRTRCVCEVERFFDAQRQPVIWVVFEALDCFALFNRKNTASANGNRIFFVPSEDI